MKPPVQNLGSDNVWDPARNASYDCRLGKIGVGGAVITTDNCNAQVSEGSDVSRCFLNTAGHCRKRQNATPARGRRNWETLRKLAPEARERLGQEDQQQPTSVAGKVATGLKRVAQGVTVPGGYALTRSVVTAVEQDAENPTPEAQSRMWQAATELYKFIRAHPYLAAAFGLKADQVLGSPIANYTIEQIFENLQLNVNQAYELAQKYPKLTMALTGLGAVYGPGLVPAAGTAAKFALGAAATGGVLYPGETFNTTLGVGQSIATGSALNDLGYGLATYGMDEQQRQSLEDIAAQRDAINAQAANQSIWDLLPSSSQLAIPSGDSSAIENALALAAGY